MRDFVVATYSERYSLGWDGTMLFFHHDVIQLATICSLYECHIPDNRRKEQRKLEFVYMSIIYLYFLTFYSLIRSILTTAHERGV